MKKQNGLLISVVILSALCLGAETDSPSVKLRPAPHKIGDIVMDSDWSILPREDVYEIGVSKLAWPSIQSLPDAGYTKLTVGEAKGLTGEYYQCPIGKAPYLIRAVYFKGAHGRFRAERNGKNLAIVFGTILNQPIGRKFDTSAVIVNLDFTSDQIYTEGSSID